jgi:2-keto-4-pentenoate hydratase/2-oxohepta-3-ene-1,7-dioic acid hydratase in catechol pathway
VRLYRTTQGLAIESDGLLQILDLPHADVAELFADDVALASTAAVREEADIESASLLSPVRRPANFILNGLLYAGHIAEAGREPTKDPVFTQCNGGDLDPPGGTILLPAGASDQVDYEGEIALVMGQRAKNVSRDAAWACVGGLTIVNDVSERREQHEGMASAPWDIPAMVRAKRHPTFKPCGPLVVTADEFDGLPDLEIQTHLNGIQVQHDWSRNMIFDFAEIVSYISQTVELAPGDVISTGTPAGVAISTGRYLQDSDVIEVQVERIGVLRNNVALGTS